MSEELYKLEKPELDNVATEAGKLIFGSDAPIADVFKLFRDTAFPKYLYWDKVKYKTLPPEIASHELMWKVIKILRKAQYVSTPIKSENGKYFSWIKISQLEEFFHTLDLNTGGSLSLFAGDVDEKMKMRFITNGIIEESIASSQLEGANTTRKVAKQFLREGRKPINKAEQMILNNYEAMRYIEDELKGKKLDTDTLLELHVILTKETMPKEDIGRFRRDDDEIIVGDEHGFIYHIPPREKFVSNEIKNFLSFCNDEEIEDGVFYHPVIKAILIHFWIGYLHLFTDGNGRLARTLFYWYLLKKGYWAFAYLPISMVIKKSPEQYKMAFVYSEQDDNDVTYFIDYNIRKIKQSLEKFQEYVNKKQAESRLLRRIARGEYHFNERQVKLLQHFYKNPDAKTFARMYANIYQVSWLTASNDLRNIEAVGFISSKKEGKNKIYYPTQKISELF